MKKLLALFCACLVLGLVAAGCGDDDEGDSGGNAATTEQTATTEQAGGSGGAAPAKKAVAIEIVDIDYEPREQTVQKGATVKWTNTGNLPHTVTKESGAGADFDSGTIEPGDSFEQKVDAAGEIDYHCTIHSNQRGSLTVQ